MQNLFFSASVPPPDLAKKLERYELHNILAGITLISKIYDFSSVAKKYINNKGVFLRTAVTFTTATLYPAIIFIDFMLFNLFLRHNVRKILKFGLDFSIFLEDNVGGHSRVLIWLCQRRSVPCIVFPYTIPNPLEPAHSLKNNPAYQVNNPIQKITAALFPHWVYSLKGRKASTPAALPDLAIPNHGIRTKETMGSQLRIRRRDCARALSALTESNGIPKQAGI